MLLSDMVGEVAQWNIRLADETHVEPGLVPGQALQPLLLLLTLLGLTSWVICTNSIVYLDANSIGTVKAKTVGLCNLNISS